MSARANKPHEPGAPEKLMTDDGPQNERKGGTDER
jgi:hypothetical protein